MDGSCVDRARFSLSRSGGSPAPPYARLDLGQTTLRVRDIGTGRRAFVTTPDPPNVLEHHDAALTSFARQGRAIGLELPGFGHSRPAPAFRFSVEENADVLLNALDALAVERAVLMFPCMTGLVALETARRAPERVEAVVLMQTPSFQDALAWTDRVDFRGLIGTPIVGQLLVRGLRRPLARSWYRAALPKGADTTDYLDGALEAYARGADYSLASALQAIRNGAPPVTPVEPPVLCVWGGADRTHRPSDPEGALALANRGRSVVFPDAGHFPDLEQPASFERHVLEFLLEESR